MNSYRLEPLKTTYRDDPLWVFAEITETCWVMAENPDEARKRVASVMRLGKAIPHQQRVGRSPWLDEKLTQCVLDNSKDNQIKLSEIITSAGARYNAKMIVEAKPADK
jgi:hypothetical protein